MKKGMTSNPCYGYLRCRLNLFSPPHVHQGRVSLPNAADLAGREVLGSAPVQDRGLAAANIGADGLQAARSGSTDLNFVPQTGQV